MSEPSMPVDSAVVVDRVDKTFKAGESDEVRALSGIDLTVISNLWSRYSALMPPCCRLSRTAGSRLPDVAVSC